MVGGLTRSEGRARHRPLLERPHRAVRNLAKYAGLPWDAILGAEIAHAYKPDPAVYLASVHALGLEPGDVCMVAAHNGDLLAAQAVGLRTAFVPRPAEHGPGQTTDLAPEGDYDVVATDFWQLADRF